mmetsp:Transcript_3962/g.11265  ORF Transcript_3962/g.11265 Transcript_3962/m.11265 type:complete len:301 (+) Transcript_3962:605-1507(+)
MQMQMLPPSCRCWPQSTRTTWRLSSRNKWQRRHAAAAAAAAVKTIEDGAGPKARRSHHPTTTITTTTTTMSARSLRRRISTKNWHGRSPADREPPLPTAAHQISSSSSSSWPTGIKGPEVPPSWGERGLPRSCCPPPFTTTTHHRQQEHRHRHPPPFPPGTGRGTTPETSTSTTDRRPFRRVSATSTPCRKRPPRPSSASVEGPATPTAVRLRVRRRLPRVATTMLPPAPTPPVPTPTPQPILLRAPMPRGGDSMPFGERRGPTMEPAAMLGIRNSRGGKIRNGGRRRDRIGTTWCTNSF